MGPLVCRRASRQGQGLHVRLGVKEGARLVVDGREFVVKGHEGGFWIGTTLFDNVTPAMKIYK
jgi:malonate-semialdehyde dehydrogenase (acetylating)/methylmalonate-semialdehyde dehydrogenase